MPPYTTFVVLALVASNVSPALSAPIPQIREQSLSRRVEIPTAAAKRALPASFMKHGKEFAWGMAATMAFSYVFEKLGSSGTKGAAAAAPAAETVASSETADAANAANNQVVNPGSTNTGNFPSTNPSYSTPPNTGSLPSTNPGYSPPPNTGSFPSPNTGYSPSTVQTQNGYQQRAADHDSRSDIFEARSASDDKDQNRRSADLLGRADLAAAIRLFSRMLDELD